MHPLFRTLIADTMAPRQRTPHARVISRNEIDKPKYYTGHVIDMGEVAAYLAMVKKPDRPALNDRLGKQENRHIGSAPGP